MVWGKWLKAWVGNSVQKFFLSHLYNISSHPDSIQNIKWFEKKKQIQSMVSGSDRAVKTSSNQVNRPVNTVWTECLSINLPYLTWPPRPPCAVSQSLTAPDLGLLNTLEVWRTVNEKNGRQTTATLLITSSTYSSLHCWTKKEKKDWTVYQKKKLNSKK